MYVFVSAGTISPVRVDGQYIFRNVYLMVYLLVGARSCLNVEFGWGSIGPTIRFFKCSGSIILMDILVACTRCFLPGRFLRSGLTDNPFPERIFEWAFLLGGARSCLDLELGWGSIGPTIMLFKCSGSIILMDI